MAAPLPHALALRYPRLRALQGATWVSQRALVKVHRGDDWAPNYPRDMVLVSLSVSLETLAAFVSVWGADDLGVERETDLATGLYLYARITRSSCPPRRSLLYPTWGFVRA